MKLFTVMALLGFMLDRASVVQGQGLCCPIDHVEPFLNVGICKGVSFPYLDLIDQMEVPPTMMARAVA
jgi:hypothetical protein